KDVGADDLLLGADADQLHQRAALVGRKSVVHGDEAAGIDPDRVAVPRPGFLLGHPHGADGWVAEHHGGDVLVHQTATLHAAEEAIRQPATSGNGHRGQLPFAGDVANGIYAGHVGLLERVGRDAAVRIHLDAGVLQPQAIRVGLAAHGPDDHLVAVQAAAVLAVQRDAAVAGTLEPGSVEAGHHMQAIGLGGFHEAITQHLV